MKNSRARRWLRRFAIVCAVTVVFPAVYLMVERIRGRVALTQRLQQLSDKGERLDLAQLLPEDRASGDDAALPFASATNELRTSKVIERAPPSLRFAAPGKAVVAWRLSEWTTYRKTNSWRIVAEDIRAAEPLLAQLHKVSEKKYFDTGFDYRKGLIEFESGPLVEVKRAAQLLNLAALYELNEGNVDAAHRHVAAALNLAEMDHEPLIIWQLIRHACALLAYNSAWQLLQHPAVSEHHLAHIQAALSRADFPGDMAQALEMERAMSLDLLRQVKSSRATRDKVIAQRDGWSEWFGSFATHGFVLHSINVPLWQFAWADQDELRTLNRWQALIEEERQARSNGWASVGTGTREETDVMTTPLHGEEKAPVYDRFRFLFSSQPFGVSQVVIRRTLEVQTQKHMLQVAVALKRFELQHNEVPSNLNALVPDLLPKVPMDEMNHTPLRYRTTGSRHFILYSAGENGIDDNGDPAPRPGQSYSQIWKGLDAVWPAQASAEETAKAMQPKE